MRPGHGVVAAPSVPLHARPPDLASLSHLADVHDFILQTSLQRKKIPKTNKKTVCRPRHGSRPVVGRRRAPYRHRPLLSALRWRPRRRDVSSSLIIFALTFERCSSERSSVSTIKKEKKQEGKRRRAAFPPSAAWQLLSKQNPRRRFPSSSFFSLTSSPEKKKLNHLSQRLLGRPLHHRGHRSRVRAQEVP